MHKYVLLKKHPLTIRKKTTVKYLRIKLTKDVQDLYRWNYINGEINHIHK